MISDYAQQEVHQLESMKTQIQNCIEALPDNENIKRVSRNAFVINSSELGKHDNWTPSFHDFKAQYRLVLDRLDKTKSMSAFQSFLDKAIENKSIKVGKHVEKLHPEVIAGLQKLL